MEYKLNDMYTIVDEGLGYELFKNGKLHRVYDYNLQNKLLGMIVKMVTCLTKIQANKERFVLFGRVYIPIDGLQVPAEKCYIMIADNEYHPVYRNKRKEVFEGEKYNCWDFEAEVPTSTIFDFGLKAAVMFCYVDENGFGYRKGLKWQLKPKKLPVCGVHRDDRLLASKTVYPRERIAAYFRQTSMNGVYISVRPRNISDSAWHDFKINLAFKAASLVRALGGNDVIVMYEKKGEKYEESASVFYEKLCDNRFKGMKKVYYILSDKAGHWDRVPKKYRKGIVKQHTFKHYFLFFYARTFFGTEQLASAIDPNVKNPLARAKIFLAKYRFVFLQHGVYYMYGLGPSIAFMYKGKGFPRYGRIVCSSETEGRHFTEYANFNREDLIVTGLPKFDRSVRDEVHDRIVIMPTYRKWEINMYEDDPTATTYYNFLLNIFNSVPERLKDKVIILPHPLLAGKFDNTPLGEYILPNAVYDDVLKKAEILITDWSSISYDAFYRGAKIIFCWEEKDECIEKFGTRLMLNDENVFSDVSRSFDDLPGLIEKNYGGPQDPYYIEKYRDIVTYHDGHNTDRLFDALNEAGYLKKHQDGNMIHCAIRGVTKKLYTGKPLEQTRLVVTDGEKLLVEDIDYKLSYIKNVEPGYGAVILRGIGDYHGMNSRRFLIRYNAELFEIEGVEDKEYTGEYVTQDIVCRFNGEVLTEKKDYVIKYENNFEPGIAKMTVNGRGKRFGGKQVMFFKIIWTGEGEYVPIVREEELEGAGDDAEELDETAETPVETKTEEQQENQIAD